MSTKNSTIELRKDEDILLNKNVVFINGFIPDNPFFESRETGMHGKFIITNQRIYYRSKKHLILRDLLKEEFSVELTEIFNVKKKNLFLFVPFFIVIKLTNGAELKFSFGFGRQKPFELLQNLINK